MARNLRGTVLAALSATTLATLLPFSVALAQTASSWEDNANGQAQDCNGNDPGGEFLFPDNNLWGQEEVFGTFPGCGTGMHLLQPSNWSTPNYPDNGNGAANYDVTLDAPANTELNLNVTIDSLTVTSSGVLGIRGASTLTIADGSLTNNSTITVNSSNVSGNTGIDFEIDTLLDGSGDIILARETTRARLRTDPGAILTQASGHTIRGGGQIEAELVNNGIVEADISLVFNGPEMLLSVNDKTNNNILRALAASTLKISGITITQDDTNGRIIAAGGTVALQGGTVIKQGRLETSGGGTVETSGAVTLDAVTNLGTLDVLGVSTVDIKGGSLTNNSTITVNSNNISAVTGIDFDVSTLLDGTGDIVLTRETSRARLTADPGVVVTQASTHTIHGVGTISAELINNGLVEADVSLALGSSSELLLNTNDKTNNHILRALTGTTLNINAITVTQDDANDRIIADNGTVKLSGAGTTIINGRLETSGTGIVEASGTATLTNVHSTGTLNLLTNGTLSVSGTSLVNDGTLTINSNDVAATTTLSILNDVSLEGSGSVLLNREGTRARITTVPGATLTHAAGHRIFGVGDIDAALINNGVIEADEASAGTGTVLDLQTNDKTNNHILRALAGSTLKVSNITLTQDDINGRLIADGGLVDLINGTTISQGRLETPNGGVVKTTGIVTLDAVTNLGVLDVFNSSTLQIAGGSLTNDSAITINPTDVNATTSMTFLTDTTLAGTGSVLLNRTSTRARITTEPGATLTHVAGHKIFGVGDIDAALINNGVIEADEASAGTGIILDLQINDKTNNSTIRALVNSTLAISGIAITQDQANGEIVAKDGGTVELKSGASIVGGTLKSELTGIVEHDAGAATLEDVTFSGTFNTLGSLTTTVTGTSLTNNGVMTVNSSNVNGNTAISFDGGVALNGTGQIVLNRASRANISTTAGSSVTQAFTHTIRGEGKIDARLINKGLIEAVDGPGTGTGLLELVGENKNNDNLMQATDGATLRITGTTVTQKDATGQIIALDGGTIDLRSGASVVQGRIRSEGTGFVQNGAGTVTLEDVTLEGTFNTLGNTTTNIAGTLLTNNATLTVNSNNVNGSTPLHFTESGSIGGTGEIVLFRATRSMLNGDPGVQLNQGANHTIRGAGQINVDLRNSGSVEGNSSTELLEINSTISGAGLLKDVRIDGTHAPGNSPRAVDVEGTYEISSTGSLEIEIGGLLLNRFDQVNGTLGTVDLDGTLDVSIIDFGFGYVPAAADSFTIITSDSPITGSFATENLPSLGGGKELEWLVTYNTNSVVLEITSAEFLAADFNEDLLVDAADLADWQTGFGIASAAAHSDGDANEDGDVDGGDFLTWQRQFQLTTASPLGGVFSPVHEPGTIPEPATPTLLLTTALLSQLRRRRPFQQQPAAR